MRFDVIFVILSRLLWIFGVKNMFLILLKAIHLLLCILIIAGVLLMNQKSEGLSGIMGSSSYSARSAKGMDEGMRRGITWLGAGLIVSAIILDIIDKTV